MKLKQFTILLLIGLFVVGCNSRKRQAVAVDPEGSESPGSGDLQESPDTDVDTGWPPVDTTSEEPDSTGDLLTVDDLTEDMRRDMDGDGQIDAIDDQMRVDELNRQNNGSPDVGDDTATDVVLNPTLDNDDGTTISGDNNSPTPDGDSVVGSWDGRSFQGNARWDVQPIN